MKKQDNFTILGEGLITLGIIFISLGRELSYPFIVFGTMVSVMSLYKRKPNRITHASNTSEKFKYGVVASSGWDMEAIKAQITHKIF